MQNTAVFLCISGIGQRQLKFGAGPDQTQYALDEILTC